MTVMNKYVEKPILPWTCDCLWWWNVKVLHSTLRSVVKKRLCVLAISVPVKEHFLQHNRLFAKKGAFW